MLADMDAFLSVIRGTYLAVSRYLPVGQIGTASVEIKQVGQWISCCCGPNPDDSVKEIVSAMSTNEHMKLLYQERCPK